MVSIILHKEREEHKVKKLEHKTFHRLQVHVNLVPK